MGMLSLIQFATEGAEEGSLGEGIGKVAQAAGSHAGGGGGQPQGQKFDPAAQQVVHANPGQGGKALPPQPAPAHPNQPNQPGQQALVAASNPREPGSVTT
jgi:hypothetical protein